MNSDWILVQKKKPAMKDMLRELGKSENGQILGAIMKCL